MPKYIQASFKNVEYAGIKWTEHYGTYRALVAGWLELRFSYSGTIKGGDYVVTVAGATIKTRGEDVPGAARIAVAAARKLMERAIAELPKESV
jgi:hypothetical protein